MTIEKVENVVYYEITGLPSKDKLYSNIKLEGRALKLLEVKKLSSMTEDNSDSIINDILRRCIKGIPIEKLSLPDKMYLIFWLRSNTYREAGYTTEYTCPVCNALSTYEFKLSNLQIQYISDQFSLDKLMFDMGDKNIKFKVLTIEDEQKIRSFKIAYLPIYKNIDEDILKYAASIETIDGENLTMNDKYEFISDLSPEHYCYLTSNIDKWDFGIKSYLEVACNKCGGTSPVGISFREDFFLPKYKVD